MNLRDRSDILITCAKGLSPILERELIALGYRPRDIHATGAIISAGRGILDAMQLNLHLRTAFNVLYLLKTFKAKTPERLYNRAQTIEWEKLIPADSYFSVVSRVETANVNNSMFASVKLKDAIVDRIAAHTGGMRPDSGPDRERIVVHLYWKDDACWVYVNTSGRKLSDRSYRKLPHHAPMQETLAAGVLLEAGYTGEEPIVCPMCGSGTLAIEAALLAMNIAPGLLRENFGMMHVIGFDHEQWSAMRSEAKAAVRDSPAASITASDIDPAAISAAKHNATAAGVDRFIEFHTCDFAKSPLPPQPGVVILNPEYGKRLGEGAKLQETYKRIGDFFKQKCAGWTGCIFTGNPDLAKKIGLKPRRRVPFWNAEIECRLLEYELYAGTRQARKRSALP